MIRYFLPAVLLVTAAFFYGCSEPEKGDDGNREITTITMTMDVPSVHDGEPIYINERSWVNGFIDLPYSENIISCVPSSFRAGTQTITLTIKRHLDTKASFCDLYGLRQLENVPDALFCSYAYEKEDEPYTQGYCRISVYSLFYETFLNDVPVYMTDVTIQAPSADKVELICNRLIEEDRLEHIDVSQCPLLEKFVCTGHPALRSLDLSNNPLLTEVNCYGNENLKETWLSAEQNITDLVLESHTEVKYK